MTGLTIICSGVWASRENGVGLSAVAFESALPGAGAYLLSIAPLIFAFSNNIGLELLRRKMLDLLGWA